MISVLIWLLILCLVAGCIYYVLQLMPLPEPFKRAATVIFLLIVCLIAIFKLLPLLGVAVP